jgi:uncharacterized membrane protein (UPF0127 family)
MRYASLLILVLLWTGCDKPQNPDDFKTSDLTLPGGQVIKIETMIEAEDLARGLMFRTSLAPDQGMLFVHPTPGTYRYWMYQVLIPLDIVWMDNDRKIIQVVVNAQPCKTEKDKCVQYASSKPTRYVLELAGGMAKKYNLKLGQQLNW